LFRSAAAFYNLQPVPSKNDIGEKEDNKIDRMSIVVSSLDDESEASSTSTDSDDSSVDVIFTNKSWHSSDSSKQGSLPAWTEKLESACLSTEIDTTKDRSPNEM
jgi:hypothetical protein